MASGPQRDVELVIRAKDEATKALGSITDSLNALADMQARVGESAGQTSGKFDQLGQALDGMKKQAAGLSALSTAVGQMDKAGEAIARLETQFANSNTRLEATRESYAKVAESIDNLKARSETVKSSLAAEQAAFRQTQVEANALASVMGKLSEALPRSEAAAKKLTTATEQEKQAYRDSRDAMMQHIEAQIRLEATAAKQQATIKELSAQQKQVGAELRANDNAYSSLANQIERQSNLQEVSNTRLTTAREAYNEMRVAADRVSGVLGNVALNTEAIGSASKNATEMVKQLNAEIAKRPSGGPAAEVGGASTPRQDLIAAKEAAAQAEVAYHAAQAAVAGLNREIKAGGEPTQQQAVALLLSKQAAMDAKGAYEQAQVALDGVRSRAREYISTSQQERAATVEAAQAARNMAAAREAMVGGNIYAQQQEEINLLSKLKTEWQELSAAMRANFVAQAEAAREQAKTVESSNSAANSLGNLKSQVLGLASAYFGLMGAMQAVKSVVDTYRTLEQAQAQLVAVHNGDQRAAASDMVFLRGQAEALGISLKDVTEQYGKLSVAAAQNNISQKTTRDLFTAVAQSARVVGLDSEHTSNVLYGFVRMIDFGKVSARDFRSVMTMIPGAQKAMDDALDQTSGHLGVTTEQFRKMQKSAAGVTVTNELLEAWATNMQKQMGDKLPYALKTFNAEWGRFQTNLQEGQNTVGKTGFMDALAAQLHRLNEFMKSDAGQQYFQNMGHALAGLVNIVGMVVDHIGLLKNAFELVIALKFGSFLTSMIPVAINLVTAFGELRVAVAAFATGTATAAEVASSAMGGLPIILGGIAFALIKIFGDTAEGVTKLDEALDKHDRMIGRLQDAYSEAGGKADEFRKKLKDLTEVQLLSGKQDLAKEVKNTLAGMNGAAFDTGIGASWDRLANMSFTTAHAVAKLSDELKSHKISVSQFRDELLKLKLADEKFGESKLFQTLADGAEKVIKGQEGLKDYDAALKLVKGGSADTADATNQLNLSMSGLGNALPTDKLSEFNRAILELKRNIPELAKAAEAQTKLQKAREDLQSSIGAAKGNPALIKQALEAYEQNTGAINAGAEFGAAQDSDRRQLLSGAMRAGGKGDYIKTANSLTPMDIDAIARVTQAEAGNQGEKGMAAVAQVIINRLANGAWGHTTNAVLNAPRQFEAVTKAGGNWAGLPEASGATFRAITDLFKGTLFDTRLTNATHYQNRRIVADRVRDGSDHANTLDFGGMQQSATIGDHTFYGGPAPRRAPSSYKSGGDFLNQMLAGVGINHKETAPDSFSKIGTNIADAGKVEPGDIVILKGKGNSAGGVGVVKDRNADGSFDVQGVFGKGRPSTRTVGQGEVAAYQRIGDAQQRFAEQGGARDQSGEFQQMIKDLVSKNRADAKALAKSPVDLAVQEAMDRLDKWLADAKAKAEREGKPFSAGYGPGQRAQVANSVRGFFDAKQIDEEGKKLAEINHAWQEILRGAEKVTAAERARQALTAKGFRFNADGSGADAPSQGALTTQTAIENHNDQKQALQDIIAKSGQMGQFQKELSEGFKEGDLEKVKTARDEIARINAEIQKGLPALRAYFTQMHDEAALRALSKVAKAAADLKVALISDKEVNQSLASGLTGVFTKMGQSIGGFIAGTKGIGGVFRDVGMAFRQFAAEFLMKIAAMIIQQRLLNMLAKTKIGAGISGIVDKAAGVAQTAQQMAAATALSAAGTLLTTSSATLAAASVAWDATATAIGVAAAALMAANAAGGAGVLHSGGIAGGSGVTRSVNMAAFSGAIRYHSGGVAGFKPNEVAAVLERGEEVLTASSPRHINNISKNLNTVANMQPSIKVVNAIDSGHMLSEALGTSHGQKAFVNYVRGNARAISGALKG